MTSASDKSNTLLFFTQITSLHFLRHEVKNVHIVLVIIASYIIFFKILDSNQLVGYVYKYYIIILVFPLAFLPVESESIVWILAEKVLGGLTTLPLILKFAILPPSYFPITGLTPVCFSIFFISSSTTVAKVARSTLRFTSVLVGVGLSPPPLPGRFNNINRMR